MSDNNMVDKITLGISFAEYQASHGDAMYQRVFHKSLLEMAAIEGISVQQFQREGYEEAAHQAYMTALSDNKVLGVDTEELPEFMEALHSYQTKRQSYAGEQNRDFQRAIYLKYGRVYSFLDESDDKDVSSNGLEPIL